jgi:hypothetical protein
MADLLSTEIRTALAKYAKPREEQIIARLIREYRDGKSTEASMRSGIAAIAELRTLLGDLDREIRLGHDDSVRHLLTQDAPGR